jgi:hypothetical protein
MDATTGHAFGIGMACGSASAIRALAPVSFGVRPQQDTAQR